ncbi:hypothetical protein PMI42_03275 [Bradyrhizobium sp. YR681]|uniref:hypothetical protein n=1 Tax=Bradyrhizobium sp. YR681 TaxID=1144344 RepID=UPI0002714118|nr:hypothetical protein [Bradyrhizobium sp. YR681]EJN13419.1 hypothetical protein PMI42_03275 [Bradyrhizobium sp. YR681]
MTHPLLTALAQARRRDAPMFVKWCELNGVSACPATPASVARFITDCAALGMDRLWPAVNEISRMHASIGLADPTLGGAAANAMSTIGAIPPPRSWPGAFKQRFGTLPYDIQVHLASHEAQRERALRRAQNEAASARQRLAAFEAQTKDEETNGNEAAAADKD